MTGALRLAWLFFRVGALNELQYRVNFVMQLFHSALALATGLVVLALVFSHTTELRGWSHGELLAVLGVHILMGGAIRVAIQPNMNRLMEEIRDGTLDYALTKPEDAQLLVSLTGDLSTAELLGGLGMQALWIGILAALFLVAWRFAIRRYSAVGN